MRYLLILRSDYHVTRRVDPEPRADRGEDLVGPPLQIGERPDVLDDVVGDRNLLGKWHLRADAGPGLFGGRAVACHGALDLDVFRGRDHDERSEGVLDAVLDDERGLVASEGLARVPEPRRCLEGEA